MYPIRSNLVDYISTQRRTSVPSYDDALISSAPWTPPRGGVYQRLKLRLEEPEEITKMRITASTPGIVAFSQTLRHLEIHNYLRNVPDLSELLYLTFFSARHVPHLTALPRQATAVTRLVLKDTPQLPSRVVRTFLSENVGITHLDLSMNAHFDDGEIAAGVAELKRLQCFVSDQVPTAPSQKKQEVAAPTGLGPTTLKALTENCEFLQEVSMQGSLSIDAMSISNLLWKAKDLAVASFSDCPRLELEPESFEAAFFGRNFRSPHDPAVTLKVTTLSPTFVEKLKNSGVRVELTKQSPVKVTPLLGPPPVQEDPKKKKKK